MIPKDHMGDAIETLVGRRGRIQSQEDRGGAHVIAALVPLSAMLGYAIELRTRTQGRGTYSMRFDRYSVDWP